MEVKFELPGDYATIRTHQISDEFVTSVMITPNDAECAVAVLGGLKSTSAEEGFKQARTLAANAVDSLNGSRTQTRVAL